jgi:dTDP-4-amino-4,6-dideoxygalactose transaminase
MRVVDVGTLNLTQRHKDKVMEALNSNRLSYGPMTAEFEGRFARLHGNKYGVMTNSGTDALRATLAAMKILYEWPDGSEVIMPATTFVATYNVILQNNLKPVLVDVDGQFNIYPPEVNRAITKKTVAIMPVHLLGKAADMESIMRIAKSNGLKVIEDSCETMFVKGIGEADVSCFSFYVAHLLVTGVGGMAITKDKELADLIRSLIFHGRDTKYLTIDDDNTPTKEVIDARFRFNHPGFSSRSTEVEAALGLVELEGYKKMLKKRQWNANYLNQNIQNIISWSNTYMEDHAFMMFPLMVDRRDELILYLEKHGVTTRTIMPLINQPYINIGKKKFPMSEWILQKGILIGCHQDLTKDDLDYVINLIDSFYDKS